MKTLMDLYQQHTGKVSDKWSFYLYEYDRIFSPYREKSISMLEIGIQNGGSLEIWNKYFTNANIFVGCDINDDCKKLKYDDPKILVVVGDATKLEVQEKIFENSKNFDLIIDDGSHTSGDIIKAFAYYFSCLNDGGIFVAEDLHCSYWSDFDGGLDYKYSSIEFFKKLADAVNFEHWGISGAVDEKLDELLKFYGAFMTPNDLKSISSIEFVNSMCIVKKRSSSLNALGLRIVAGQDELVVQGHKELHMKKYDLKSQTGHFNGFNKKSNVCVIIPYYNGSSFIERALNSVFSQSVKADEVIVVNDGSAGVEADFLHALSSSYDIKVFDKENGGQGSARNYGVLNSSSKYISFLDQDDFYLNGHIEDLLNAIPKDDRKFGFVYGDLHEADGKGNLISVDMIKKYSTHPKVHINNLIAQDMFILPSASLIDRDAYLAVEGFDSQFTGYEDDDLFLRIFRAGYSNIYLDKPVTTWCIHQESTSYSVKMCRSRFRYLKKLVEMFPDNPDASRFYFRDLISPRFHSLIINDAIKYKIKKLPDCDEVFGILGGYVELFVKNPSIPKFKKLKIRVMQYLLTKSNGFIFGILYKIRNIKNNL